MIDQGLKRTTFEKLVIAKSYISILQKENEALKALLVEQKEEREAESKSFIEARNHILKLNPAERKQIQKEAEVLEWKKRAKILREGMERLEAENKKLKLQNDHLIQKIAENKGLINYNGQTLG